MSYKDISAGEKTAKLIASRFIQSKGGKMAFEGMFEFDERDHLGNPVRCQLPWQGWLSGGAFEKTMDTLADVFEFNGDSTVVQVPEGDRRKGMLANQDAVNRKKDYRVTVEFEEYNGKQRPKIQWVNNIGGGGYSGVDVQTLESNLGAIGFKAAFLARKENAKARASEQSAPVQSKLEEQNPFPTEDDVGF